MFIPVISVVTALAAAPPAAIRPEPGNFVATTSSGDRPAGRLTGLGSDGTAELVSPNGTRIVRDLISLRRATYEVGEP